MPTKLASSSRRRFIRNVGFGALFLVSGVWSYRRHLSPRTYRANGKIVGANAKIGHLMRTGVSAKPTRIESINTLIVGGGIAGLSAAWWLEREGFKNFRLFEMDTDVGGNSSFGGNSVSSYPWGAHYIPIPGEDAIYVRALFEELGVIERYENGLPFYNEFFLCADSNERLLFQGEWQEGLVPLHGVTKEVRLQYESFFSFIKEMKEKRGSDGKRAFAIPMELSSQDEEFLKLDRISMADFMKSRGWTAETLNWYVNYCCRDDYGRPQTDVSAWAGLHYFASRNGKAVNADSSSVLTWPEGNGYFVKRLKDKLASHIQSQSLVFRLETTGQNVLVDVLDTQTNICTRYEADHVIYAGQRFTADKTIEGYQTTVDLDYAPWLIANVTLSEKPQSYGQPYSWDNVSYYSPSLGYIAADHQELKLNRKRSVVTYYRPLDEAKSKAARQAAYVKSHQDWVDQIVPDLESMHRGISKTIEQLDVWIWGHGMINPGIDFLWSEKRKTLLKSHGRIEFAHSDMSGISIFEEAQFRGVEAAKKILMKAKA